MLGVRFDLIVKAQIVRLDWDLWDRRAPKPAEYPVGGEPEHCILSRPHDPQLANEHSIARGAVWRAMLVVATSFEPGPRACLSSRGVPGA